MSRLAHETGNAFRDFVERSAAALLLLALPLAAGGAALADPIIDLVFGDAYADAAPVFPGAPDLAAALLSRLDPHSGHPGGREDRLGREDLRGRR